MVELDDTVGCKVGKSYKGSYGGPPVISLDDLDFNPEAFTGTKSSFFDGEKYPTGFGVTQLFTADYWTLRLRSAQLFKENLYARGLIRRLVTNEINTGLGLEAIPNSDILDIGDDFRNDWSENVEARFNIWAKNPLLCDYNRRTTFGPQQAEIRREALIEGDILVTLVPSRVTNLPQVRLVPGSKVQTPMGVQPRAGNEIIHGVEIDKRNRHVAFWVTQRDGTSKRVPAFGEKTGRRLAWLYYGTDKRFEEVRGEPILSIVMQSLKEIDRYRDSAQRKATINSILAMFIEKGENKLGTKPMGGGATKRGVLDVTDNDGKKRKFNIANQIPGLILDELQYGEKPHGFDSAGTDINFPIFEAAIVSAFAWANEVPPEILTLVFQKSFSASRSAQSEFKLYLNPVRTKFAEVNCDPFYQEFLLAETMMEKISAPGLLQAFRDPKQYDIYGAWIATDWSGAIKPSADMNKDVKAYMNMDKTGYITADRATSELTGQKFSTNMRRKVKENELRVKAMRPFFELEKEFGLAPGTLSGLGAITASSNNISEDLTENIVEALMEQMSESIQENEIEL